MDGWAEAHPEVLPWHSLGPWECFWLLQWDWHCLRKLPSSYHPAPGSMEGTKLGERLLLQRQPALGGGLEWGQGVLPA